MTRESSGRRPLLAAVAVVALLAGVSLAVLPWLSELTDPAWVRARIESFGPFAPAAFVTLQATQVVVAPIPGQVLGGVAGLLFGTLAGAAYSLLGVVLGSALAFALARRFGRPWLERTLHRRTLARWDRFVQRTGQAGLFVLFLLPTFPDDLLCFVAGVSDIEGRRFLTLVAVGRAPSFLAVAYAGEHVGDGALGPASLVLTLLTLSSLVVLYEKEAIVAALSARV